MQVVIALTAALVAGAAAVAVTATVQLRRRLRAVQAAIRQEAQRTRQLITDEAQARAAQRAEDTARLEATARRMLTVLERERLAAADRHREIAAAVDHSRSEAARVPTD